MRCHSSRIQRKGTQLTLHEAGIGSPLTDPLDARPWSLQQSALILTMQRLAAGTWTSYGMSWGCRTCKPAGRLHSGTHTCCKLLQHAWRSQPSSCTCCSGQPQITGLLHVLRIPQCSIHWHWRSLYTAACWPDMQSARKSCCKCLTFTCHGREL